MFKKFKMLVRVCVRYELIKGRGSRKSSLTITAISVKDHLMAKHSTVVYNTNRRGFFLALEDFYKDSRFGLNDHIVNSRNITLHSNLPRMCVYTNIAPCRMSCCSAFFPGIRHFSM